MSPAGRKRLNVCLSSAVVVAFAVVLAMRAYERFPQQPPWESPLQESPEARTAGAPGSMMCPMMVGLRNIQLTAHDPAVVLADSARLELTAYQRARLEQIQQAAGRQAMDVLGHSQREPLAHASGELSPIQLAHRRLQDMPLPEQHGAGMCPVCLHMMARVQRSAELPR